MWFLKKEIHYSTDVCSWCRPETLENTDHIFSCPRGNDLRQKLAIKMIKDFNNMSELHYTSLPFWFSVDFPEWSGDGPAGRNLAAFPKAAGNTSQVC